MQKCAKLLRHPHPLRETICFSTSKFEFSLLNFKKDVTAITTIKKKSSKAQHKKLLTVRVWGGKMSENMEISWKHSRYNEASGGRVLLQPSSLLDKST